MIWGICWHLPLQVVQDSTKVSQEASRRRAAPPFFLELQSLMEWREKGLLRVTEFEAAKQARSFQWTMHVLWFLSTAIIRIDMSDLESCRILKSDLHGHRDDHQKGVRCLRNKRPSADYLYVCNVCVSARMYVSNVCMHAYVHVFNLWMYVVYFEWSYCKVCM